MARPPSGSNLNINDLQRMLGQRKSELSKLRKERASAQKEVDALDRQIAKLEGGGGGGRRGGGRARNAVSLGEALRNVLRDAGKPMGVGDLEEAVLATGYRTSSDNFRGIVNQTLIKDAGFSQAGRGVYELKERGGGRGKAKKDKSDGAGEAT